MPHTLTTCTFCGVGCGLYLETAGQRFVGVYPSMSHPTNAGRICVRGWHVHEVAGSPERLRQPLLRGPAGLREVSWDDALGYVAGRLTEIRDRHGPDALAFLNSPRCSNEEAYLLQKLARSVLGTNNVDHGTGVYSHNSIPVLLEQLGVAAATDAIGNLARSDVLLVDGVDLARQLPTIGGIVLRARLAGAKLIVADTRRHRIAESADFFLQLHPGTEALLYGAMAKVIADRGLLNLPFLRARCRNHEAFLASLAGYDLLGAAQTCGVPADVIEAAAVAFARARAASVLYSTADEGRSPDCVAALINLSLLTGQIGRPGAGIFPLAEHNNLQGACDMGMLPNRLPGYGLVTDAACRHRFETAWGTSLPDRPGINARRLLSSPGETAVRGLWLGRYDPVNTACIGRAEQVLRSLDLLVLQHLFPTGAAEFAHVVLPTTAFGEEEVTFTSTDRRIQLARQAVAAPSGPRPAWRQIADLANLLGAHWSYSCAADVLREITRVVPDYSGATHNNLQCDYGRHWPCTRERPLGTPTLFHEPATGPPFHLRPIPRPARIAPPDPAHPFTLLFGDSLYYWHQNVLIRHSEALHREYRILLLDYPRGFVEIHSDDARRLGIRDGDRIRLCTDHGCATAAARVTPEVRAGTVHVPYFLREVEQAILGDQPSPGRLVAIDIRKEAA